MYPERVAEPAARPKVRSSAAGFLRGRVALGGLSIAALAVAFWLVVDRRAGAGESASTGVVVVSASPERGAPERAKRGEPAPPPRAAIVPVSPATAFAIAAAAGEPGAAVRDVRLADARRQVFCGELSSARRPQSRRFVWLAAVRMLSIDDGTSDFSEVSRMCDG